MRVKDGRPTWEIAKLGFSYLTGLLTLTQFTALHWLSTLAGVDPTVQSLLTAVLATVVVIGFWVFAVEPWMRRQIGWPELARADFPSLAAEVRAGLARMWFYGPIIAWSYVTATGLASILVDVAENIGRH